jgi:hypothetical protein
MYLPAPRSGADVCVCVCVSPSDASRVLQQDNHSFPQTDPSSHSSLAYHHNPKKHVIHPGSLPAAKTTMQANATAKSSKLLEHLLPCSESLSEACLLKLDMRDNSTCA